MANIYEKLNVLAVQEIVRTERLKWFGHVERRDSDEWISKCRYISFDDVGGKGRGRGMKTMDKYVKQDINLLGLNKKEVLNRAKWRISIMIKSLTRIHYGTVTVN